MKDDIQAKMIQMLTFPDKSNVQNNTAQVQGLYQFTDKVPESLSIQSITWRTKRLPIYFGKRFSERIIFKSELKGKRKDCSWGTGL